jgi:hypothetical protein
MPDPSNTHFITITSGLAPNMGYLDAIIPPTYYDTLCKAPEGFDGST